MKTIKVLVVLAVLCSSIPFLAQSATQSANGSASASASANSSNAAHSASVSGGASGAGTVSASRDSGASGSASGAGGSSAQMTPVSGELAGKLDSKTARVGDPVVLKTTQTARTADGVVIPKGSRLLGHVTAVQAHGHGSQDSELAMQFDRAELKNGQSMAIHSVVESVSPSRAAVEAAEMNDTDTFASGSTAPGGMAMGGGAVGGARSGGLVGGSRGLVGGTGSLAGGAAGAAGSATGNVAQGTRSTYGNVGAAAGSGLNVADGSVRGMAGSSGSLAAHSTEIPGVMLGGDASGAASGVLSASRRNVHLDSGTQMVLGVSSAVSK
jgi:hypothetical protein